jgi:hypothetical protein
MEIKSYDDILKLPAYFATQMTSGLEARFRKLPASVELPAAVPHSRKKKKQPTRAAKHK